MGLGRIRDVEALRTYLEQQEFPRLQMLLMVSLTGLAGFLADWLMLHGGIRAMAWRYGLAVVCAYGVFLGLLRLWLSTQGQLLSTEDLPVEDAADVADGGELALDVAANAADPRGGAMPIPGSSSSGGISLELDEGMVVVFALAAVAGLVVASGYLIWQAPAILAEVLLNGALSAGLYKRMKGVEPASFVGTALRKTVWPFAVVAVLMSAAGWAIQGYAPEARTLKGAWHHYQNGPPS